MSDRLTQQSENALNDRLLSSTVVFLRTVQYLLAAFGGIIACLIAILWLLPSAKDEYMKISGSDTLVSDSTIMILTTTVAIVIFFILSHLIKIVKTVGQSKPFTMENAERLRKIAYLSLGILAADFVTAAIDYCYNKVTLSDLIINYGDPSDIITILILFVLARVFEEGVRLNDEAQFTV